MVWDIIVPIFTELIKDPIKNIVVSAKRHIGYALNSDAKIEKLRDATDDLKNRRVSLQKKVEEDSREGKEIHDYVNKWLSSADEAIDDAESHIGAKEAEQKKRCFTFISFCPDFIARYKLSKTAEMKVSAIGDLGQKREGFGSISYSVPPQQKTFESVLDREGLQSRMSFLKDVMAAVRDATIDLIGVHGTGGVGKTTLAKEVHRIAIEEKLFDAVVFVAVNRSPEIKRIQGAIGAALGLKFNTDEEVLVRAKDLYDGLKKKNKILIVLDDVWDQLKLGEVGIPVGDEHSGCKILVTSRQQNVCVEMGAKKNFSVGILSNEEALALFEKMLPDARDSEFHPVLVEISKKCGGLPLLIEAVAKDLKKYSKKGVSLRVWRDKLEQLSKLDNDDLYEKVHKVFASSYENLSDYQTKSFFLLCGMSGQSNIEIQLLLKYIMGLFENIDSVECARGKLERLIFELKEASLLLDGDMDGFVKIHDVVRDAAISIANREEHAFVRINGFELKRRPEEDRTRISLPYCRIEKLSAEGWACPRAEILLLFTEDFSLQIPDLFFQGMRRLKLVHLTGMHFESLPSSLGFLSSIQTLCLHRCQLDNVAVIGQLKLLEVLSFADSYIVELPRGMEQLTELKLLDLTNCAKLKFIGAKLLSKLSKLEELYMWNSFHQWEEIGGGQGNISLAELKVLSRLSTLEMSIPSSVAFSKLQTLKKYKINIGGADWRWAKEYKTSKSLRLTLVNEIHMDSGIKYLLTEAEELCLDNKKMARIGNALCDLDEEGFPNLKHLCVQSDSVIEQIINSFGCQHAFPVLETLSLINLHNMQTPFCCGLQPAEPFRKLRKFEVMDCNNITHLFSFSIAKCLSQLQVLRVNSCDAMECIITVDDGHGDEVIEFAELVSLELWSVGKLKSFCNRKEEQTIDQTHEESECESDDTSLVLFNGKEEQTIDQTHEESECKSDDTSLVLFNGKISFPKLVKLTVHDIKCKKIWQDDQVSPSFSNITDLTVSKCDHLEYLFTGSFLQSLVQLRKLEVRYCVNMKEIVLTEGKEDKIIFPKLEFLRLIGLKKLSRFCSGYSLEFQSLKELTIIGCGELMSFAPVDTSISAASQSLFDQRVFFSCLKIMNLHGLNDIQFIWNNESTVDDSFNKLKSLKISECQKLLTIFSSCNLRKFRYVESLDLQDCDSLQEIYRIQQTFSGTEIENASTQLELRDLCIKNLPSMKSIWSSDPRGAFTFQKLQSVFVSYCQNLKNLFPVSVARDLIKLEKLTVKNCGVEEIIAKAERVEEPHICFKFPELSSLEFINLQKLISFHPGLHSSVWPKIKHVKVIGCHKITKFAPKNHIPYGGSQRNSIGQPMFLVEEVRHNLEKVTIESHDLQFIEVDQFPVEQLSKLKVIELISLHDKGRLFLQRVCRNLDKLIVKEGSIEVLFSHADISVRVELLELSGLDHLKHICGQYSKQEQLQHLRSLKIYKCNSLVNIAPSSSSFENLSTLEVTMCDGLKRMLIASVAKTMCNLTKMSIYNCKNMKVIVENDGDGHIHDEIVFNNLKTLELYNLNTLTSFCSCDIAFNFPILVQVKIENCLVMKIFSVGHLSAPKLYEVSKQWEGDLNTTVASKQRKWIIDNCESSSIPIPANSLKMHSSDNLCNKNPRGISDFKSLTTLKVKNCSSLKYAFTWSMASCLSNMEKVEIKSCKMIEGLIEAEESGINDKIVFKSLSTIMLEHLPKFSSFYSGNGDLEYPKLLSVELKNVPKFLNFYSGSGKWESPSVESICITEFQTSHPKLDSKKREMVFPKFESLSLDSKSITLLQSKSAKPFLSTVKSISLKSFQYNFHVCSVRRLINLEKIEFCDSSVRQIIEFEGIEDTLNFQSLEVRGCANLISVALSFPYFQKLRSLCVFECNGLINIFTLLVARSMNQLMELTVSRCNKLTEIVAVGEQDGAVDEIVFTNLKILKLDDLQSLEAFCLGKQAFSFPCLEKVRITKLPNLRIFCSGVVSTPKVSNIKLTQGDLNATIEKMHMEMVGFKYIKNLKLSTCPMLKEKWQSQFRLNFKRLRELVVDDCEGIFRAIPSNLLYVLGQLKVLVVQKCYLLEEVFDLDGLSSDIIYSQSMCQLSELQLIDLPNLRHVWNKIPQGVLNFRSLTILKVQNCCSLTSVFTFSTASRLASLQQLEVRSCNSMKHIVTTEEDKETDAFYITIFPQLKSVTLDNLYNLSSFHSGNDVLLCPSLKSIKMVDCPQIKLFAFYGYYLHIFSGKIQIPFLEELKVEWNIMNDALNKKFGVEFLQRLKVIEITYFPDESTLFPTHFHQGLPNLEKLVLSSTSSKENVHQDLDIAEAEKQLINEKSQTESIFENLKILEVVECSKMKVALPFSVGFQNLTTLKVSKCDGLINVMTVSIARSLMQLKQMNVKECKSMKEIVESEAANGEQEVIQFKRLKYLGLHDLPLLKSFYSGNCAIDFPSLKEVIVRECPTMEIFSHEVLSTPKLWQVQIGEYKYESEWTGSLNSTIQALSTTMKGVS